MSNLQPDLRVPGEYATALLSLARLDPDAFRTLTEALDRANPRYDRREIATLIAETSSWSLENGEVLTEVLLSLPAVVTAFNAPDIDAIANAISQNIDAGEEDLDRPELARRMVAAVRSRSFDLLARGQELVGEYEHSFISARVLSDIRPTFAPGSSSQIDGAVAVHSLRLRYRDLEPREIVLTLDLQDLKALARIVDRAISKEEALEHLLGRAAVPFIRPEETDPEQPADA